MKINWASVVAGTATWFIVGPLISAAYGGVATFLAGFFFGVSWQICWPVIK